MVEEELKTMQHSLMSKAQNSNSEHIEKENQDFSKKKNIT